MTTVLNREMTVAEAAFVAEVPVRAINQEIEASVVKGRMVQSQRRLSGKDVVYLKAVGTARNEISRKLRKRLHDAVLSALDKERKSAEVDCFRLYLTEAIQEVLHRISRLEEAREKFVASDPKVLGGDEIIKGTRISIQQIAELAKSGADRREIASELDLTQDQIEAALLVAQTSPKRGRPKLRRRDVTEHVPSNR